MSSLLQSQKEDPKQDSRLYKLIKICAGGWMVDEIDKYSTITTSFSFRIFGESAWLCFSLFFFIKLFEQEFIFIHSLSFFFSHASLSLFMIFGEGVNNVGILAIEWHGMEWNGNTSTNSQSRNIVWTCGGVCES